MNTSDRINEIVPALVALQVKLQNPTKDALGAERGGRKIPYLSLPRLLDHISEPRKEAGIAIGQEVTDAPTGVAITTILFHLSGQWIALGPAIFPAANDSQARGSAISYGRRYTLLAALGLAAEDDDAASANSSPAQGLQGVRRGGDGDADRATTADATGEGATSTVAPVEGEEAPASTPSAQRGQARSMDAARAMEEYHPGKPHRMTRSETVPDMLTCKQASPAQYGCAYVLVASPDEVLAGPFRNRPPE